MEFLVLLIVLVMLVSIYLAFDFSSPAFVQKQHKAQCRMEQLYPREDVDNAKQQPLTPTLRRSAVERFVPRPHAWGQGRQSSNQTANAAMRRRQRARARLRRIRAQGEASASVQAKLIWMLNGDRTEAERLVARQRFGTQGIYSEEDYWQQAIQEVERQQISG